MSTEPTIAGHRVLRLLATGTRSHVWLAAGDVVLKVLARPVAAGQPALEAGALARAQGDHVVDLTDVSLSVDALFDDALSDDTLVLIFPRLPRGSLADVLAARQGLDAGEAVTMLAPVAGCLARMHAAGVAHGALTASHVLFRADGAPMLIGFGSASLFEPGLPEVAREVLPEVITDRRALAALADAVLSRVAGPRATAAAAFAARLREAPLDDLEQRLARELFELAAARPVVFDTDRDDAAPARAIAVTQVAEPARPDTPALRGVLASVLESGPAVAVRRAVEQRWHAWSPGRRRIALGAGVAAAVLAIAVTTVPSPARPGPAAPEVLTPAATAVAQPAGPPAVPSTSVTGDDPLAAVTDLAERRDACFRDVSVLCLDDVDQVGSAAYDDDRAALEAVMADGAVPTRLVTDGAVIVERLGDSVLIALGPGSDPASVLLLKGEAGWRFRDYLAG